MQCITVKHTSYITEIQLSRPERSNAFNAQMIAELTAAFEATANCNTRVILLTSDGKHFCAGADLEWMKQTASLSNSENKQDARALAKLFETIDSSSIPTIALCHGAAFGGGIGLLACCDIVICDETALFSLSEVKIGLVPATISPFVVRAIGTRQMRRFALTGERFDSTMARHIGLVHTIVSSDSLHAKGRELATLICNNAPHAVALTKELIRGISSLDHSEITEHTSQLIADVRTSDEGQHGLQSFIEKQPPHWKVTIR